MLRAKSQATVISVFLIILLSFSVSFLKCSLVRKWTTKLMLCAHFSFSHLFKLYLLSFPLKFLFDNPILFANVIFVLWLLSLHVILSLFFVVVVSLSFQIILRILSQNFKNPLCSWIISIYIPGLAVWFLYLSLFSHATRFFSHGRDLGGCLDWGERRGCSLLSPGVCLPLGLSPMDEGGLAGSSVGEQAIPHTPDLPYTTQV